MVPTSMDWERSFERDWAWRLGFGGISATPRKGLAALARLRFGPERRSLSQTDRHASARKVTREMDSVSVAEEVVFSDVEEGIARIRAGGMVVVVDDEDRENEGDIIMAADAISPADLAFILRHGTGIVCVSLPGDRLDELQIPLMVERNTEIHSTAFTVSVDVKGSGTGVSAADRTLTIRALSAVGSRAEDFVRPGHVFPLRAHPDGVLGRQGHTEASADLVRLSGRRCGGVLCEVMNPDGTMARLPDLVAFATTHDLPLVSIADLVGWRRRNDSPRRGQD
jgi:3,4-dihydroxy-2-butanone 4-phosphate synthase